MQENGNRDEYTRNGYLNASSYGDFIKKSADGRTRCEKRLKLEGLP